MRIIIVDSSAVVRTILEQNLKKFPEIIIINSVASCQKILKTVISDTPDAIVCGTDINDPDEKEALNIFCKEIKLPVLLLNSAANTTSPFLPGSSKLLDKIEKPALNNYSQDFFNNLIKKLNALIEKNPKGKAENSDNSSRYKILCIGASTGGPTAVSEVLNSLGNKFPLPILYAQHIEVDKDKPLADWLNSVCRHITIKLAEDGEEAKPGFVYMAPADRHLIISYLKTDGTPVLRLSDEAPERYLRPAVNKLFKSAAEKYKNNVIAVLLTGMGADGAAGCKEICDKGGWTIVEDKSTCAVFGMPAAAIDAGGAKEVLPRPEISKRILELVANGK